MDGGVEAWHHQAHWSPVYSRQDFTIELQRQYSPKLAARFLQIENQLLMLIDLQVASNLPIVE